MDGWTDGRNGRTDGRKEGKKEGKNGVATSVARGESSDHLEHIKPGFFWLANKPVG
jgi:hypothetical protein